MRWMEYMISAHHDVLAHVPRHPQGAKLRWDRTCARALSILEQVCPLHWVNKHRNLPPACLWINTSSVPACSTRFRSHSWVWRVCQRQPLSRLWLLSVRGNEACTNGRFWRSFGRVGGGGGGNSGAWGGIGAAWITTPWGCAGCTIWRFASHCLTHLRPLTIRSSVMVTGKTIFEAIWSARYRIYSGWRLDWTDRLPVHCEQCECPLIARFRQCAGSGIYIFCWARTCRLKLTSRFGCMACFARPGCGGPSERLRLQT